MRTSTTFLLALLVLGCKSSSAPGSCYREKDSACTEYDAAKAAAGQRLCTGYRWSAGSCPVDGRVGQCAREGGKALEYLYTGPPNHFTAEAAKAACESGGGAFTAP